MQKIVPKERPKIDRAEVERILESQGAPKPCVVFVRGYYEKSMGDPAKNDRGIYDDAAIVIGGPNAGLPAVMKTFNANADPSIYRKGVAVVEPGLYPYRRGNHGISRPGGGYPAFRPATPGEKIPARRDGQPGLTYAVATNIHKGSRQTTSSLGCLTIHPDQWKEFYATVDALMKRTGEETVMVLLITEQTRRDIAKR